MPTSVIGLQRPRSPISARFITKVLKSVLLLAFPNDGQKHRVIPCSAIADNVAACSPSSPYNWR